MKLCNVPQDLLAKQVMIDTIPDMVLIVVIASLLAGLCYLHKTIRYDMSGNDVASFGLVIIILATGATLWTAQLLKHIVTALANPEYAAIVKFAAECAK